MPKFTIQIEETTTKSYDVVADDYDEAVSEALERYDEGDVGDDPDWEMKGGFEIV